jgi:hypothetical protein
MLHMGRECPRQQETAAKASQAPQASPTKPAAQVIPTDGDGPVEPNLTRFFAAAAAHLQRADAFTMKAIQAEFLHQSTIIMTASTTIPITVARWVNRITTICNRRKPVDPVHHCAAM